VSLPATSGDAQAGAVYRPAGLAGVGRVEDVLEDPAQPGDLFVGGDPLDGQEAVVAEERNLLAGGRDLEDGGGRRTEQGLAHAKMLAADNRRGQVAFAGR